MTTRPGSASDGRAFVHPRAWPVAIAAAAVIVATGPAVAQTHPDDEEELGWSDTAELNVVATGGNAEASTLGFTNQLAYRWEDATFTVDLGSLRAESTRVIRRAVGSSSTDFEVFEDTMTEVTTERYFGRSRYDHDLSSRTFWYAGLGWERNTFAGIQNRYAWDGGVGNTWVDSARWLFHTSYGVSYTVQDDVTDNPAAEARFAGFRLSYDIRLQLTDNTEYTSTLIADENLRETADVRTDLTNAVAVDMNSLLALEISWQLLFDNRPSLATIPLVDPGGAPTGDTVTVPLGRTDHVLTFALVGTL